MNLYVWKTMIKQNLKGLNKPLKLLVLFQSVIFSNKNQKRNIHLERTIFIEIETSYIWNHTPVNFYSKPINYIIHTKGNVKKIVLLRFVGCQIRHIKNICFFLFFFRVRLILVNGINLFLFWRFYIFKGSIYLVQFTSIFDWNWY